MSYLFHPAAEAEYLETIGYYESKQAGLGATFLYDFEQKMSVICSNPKLYQTQYTTDIRRAPMSKFPYTIIYRLKAKEIQILAVANQRRRPSYWLGRL
jgi:toxin ParE1/3/4